MLRRHVERGRGWGEMLVLALAFALSVPALSFAVAPPIPVPEEPGPGPVFNPDDIHINPENMAMAVIGSTASPASGPLVTAATLVAGVKSRAWNLDGVMTNRYNRRSYGAAMLISSGFNPGGSQLSQLALLPLGQERDFWALRNTDKLLYLPPSELSAIQDGHPIGAGGIEAEIFCRFLIRAFFTSNKAFESGVRTDLTYIHLLGEPERYRGEVVRIEGRLRRINRFSPPREVEQEGASALYEAYILSDVFGASPYRVYFTNWPDDLPLSYLGQEKLKENVRVRVDGYFVKTYKYKASDGRGTERESPMIVAHSLLYEKPVEAPADSSKWVQTLFYSITGTLGALLLGVFGVTYWYRRNDTATRLRLRAHAPEFVLPTPDAPPQSPPMAMPVRPPNGADRSVPMRPRITFPSTGKSEGERGESSGAKEGQPPDEGAGA